MQVAYENMIDALYPDLAAAQLQLGSFGAINKEKPLVMVYQVRCRIALERWNCRITAEYGYIKYHIN
jgi:hypothetical protein